VHTTSHTRMRTRTFRRDDGVAFRARRPGRGNERRAAIAEQLSLLAG